MLGNLLEKSARRRPLMVTGALLLVGLALVVVLVPMLLLPSEHNPQILPPPPAPAAERPEPPADGYGPTPDEAAPSETPTEPEPVTEPLEPVAEPRHVLPGREPPELAAASQPTATSRSTEWDRSEKARQQGLARFGGTPLTESAVEAGLAWLAAHQAPDGTWDRLHFDRQCPADDRCLGAPVRRENDDLTAGVSGLALLAFLGAGYTDRDGPYPNVIRDGVDALLRLQEPHGGFSRTDSMAGYNDAVATLALAEYLALTNEERVRAPLNRAVARLVTDQQALGGWDYLPTPTSGRNDASISAWAVQALHACAAAKVDVPRRALVRAALFFAQATERDGRVRYSDAGSGFRLDDNLRPVYRYGPGLMAAGMTCEQLLGWRLDAANTQAQRGLLLADLPSAAKARGRDPTQLHGEYYWYYGTLAMFQRGGEDWERWNGRLRDAMLPLQNREKSADGKKKHAFGSWPPFGPNWGTFGRMGGRVYVTAISTLTLEIYYRHTPAFLAEDVLFTPDDWRAYLDGLTVRERLAVIACLGQLRVEVGEPVLVRLLGDEERRVALAAAEALAALDSPAGVPLMEQVIATMSPWERQMVEKSLARAKAVTALPPVEGRIRVYDAETRRATVELPRSYVGMPLEVKQLGGRGARLHVIQRFSGHNIAVAEVTSDSGAAVPAAGQRVVGQ